MTSNSTAMTPQDALIAAANLIERTGWTQGCHARDAAGNQVAVDSRDAKRFCTEGALISVTNYWKRGGDADAYYAACQALNEPCARDIARWNDTPGRTQAEVVALLRRAGGQENG